jgi:F-type H+-transporting ATPase subunit b
VEFLSVAGDLVRDTLPLFTEAGGEEVAGFQINLFWIIVQAISFLVFLALLYVLALKRIGGVLEQRRQTIEQGLRDAEQARRDREAAAAEHAAALAEARREANEILTRAQRVAQESRDADMAATREELERLRQRAADEIEAEKQRAMAELRTEVTDLALMAAGKVIGASMTDERQRQLVAEFLRDARNVESRG